MNAQQYFIEKANNDLLKFSKLFKCSSLKDRIKGINIILKELEVSNQLTYRRVIQSPTGRKVLIEGAYKNEQREMLMFASNNYLGFANHPYILEMITRGMKKYGAGLGGPPLLNGYTMLMKELEARISNLKKKEDTLIFSSGYAANLGLVSSFSTKKNHFVIDKYSHASLYDGLKMNHSEYDVFKHNDMAHLDAILTKRAPEKHEELFICAEGVYSMDGDLAPIPEIVALSEKHNAITIIDDAHGTGLLGEHGGGTPEHFNMEKEVSIIIGTFSKAFAQTGGFVSADKSLINYIRYFARPYVFSAALTPTALIAMLAGLDLIEKEPWRRTNVIEITKYANSKLSNFKLCASPEAAIISVLVPEWMNIRVANSALDKMGIFLNAIEFPAVPINKQRFRISLTADHTKKDIDYLVECLELVWEMQKIA